MGSDPLDLLGRLLPVYVQMLRSSPEANAAWVQIDEPCWRSISEKAKAALVLAYAHLAPRSGTQHPARQLFRSAR